MKKDINILLEQLSEVLDKWEHETESIMGVTVESYVPSLFYSWNGERFIQSKGNIDII